MRKTPHSSSILNLSPLPDFVYFVLTQGWILEWFKYIIPVYRLVTFLSRPPETKNLMCLVKFLIFCTCNHILDSYQSLGGQNLIQSLILAIRCEIPTKEDLIFVTNITNIISGEKNVMWRNFSFPCMTIVGKLKISPHVEKFQMSPHDRCGEI